MQGECQKNHNFKREASPTLAYALQSFEPNDTSEHGQSISERRVRLQFRCHVEATVDQFPISTAPPKFILTLRKDESYSLSYLGCIENNVFMLKTKWLRHQAKTTSIVCACKRLTFNLVVADNFFVNRSYAR